MVILCYLKNNLIFKMGDFIFLYMKYEVYLNLCF